MAGAPEFWSTDAAPRAQLGDQWEALLSTTHLPWSVTLPRDQDAGFQAQARRWWIDDLALVDCECGPCAGSRGRRQIAATDGEFVVVLITRSGRETVSQSGSHAQLRPGDAVAWDSTHPATFDVGERLSKRSLLIPRAALDEVGGRSWSRGGVMLDGAAPATRLLTAYLAALREALPLLDPGAVRRARNATVELVLGSLRADGATNPAASRSARRAVMDRYIEQHLLGAPVTPASLARAHGVSFRTVHRMFNATGQTVSEVVRVRRLARARDELTATDRPIATIAHRWGFADTSHFSRTFKARYGTSPHDYRIAARSAPGGTDRHTVGTDVQRPAGQTSETGVSPARR